MSSTTRCKPCLYPAGLVIAALLLASCSQVATRSPADYIGPAPGGAVTQPVVAKPPGPTSAPADAATRPTPPAAASQPAPPEPLSVAIIEAVLMCLENNQDFVVQRFGPQVARAAVQAQRAQFDPVLSGSLTSSHRKGRSPTTQPHTTSFGLSRGLSGQIGISESLPTGTDISVTGGMDVSYPDTEAFDEFFASRIGVNVTQPLLQGFGLDVNLASLRQARIDVIISQYELRGFAENLVAQVQETYWDYALAAQRIAIEEQSLQLAKRQLEETAERVRIGQLAELELAAPQAQVALREGNLIDARSELATKRRDLLLLLNPGGPQMWNRDIILRTQPGVPEVDLGSVEEHVDVAMRMRADLNHARLLLQKNELTIVRTKNGLLPKLDLFITLGRTGYAESFGGSLHGRDGLGYDVQFGGSFEFPPVNRAARKEYTDSVLSRSQQIETIRNQEQLAQVDVRNAYGEVGRTREQVTVTAATRRLQEETLRAETAKFAVGKSTALLVAVAQRDLRDAQIAEVKSVVGYLKALIELYHLDGTLLVRMGIQAPGVEPTPSPAPQARS